MTGDLELIRKYEPVLRFSKDGEGNPENFFPLAAKRYVQECGLRCGRKGWVHPPGKTLLKHLGEVQKPKECFLVYAAGDLPDSDNLLWLFDQGLELARVGDTVMPRLVVSRDTADVIRERLLALGDVERRSLVGEIDEWLTSVAENTSSMSTLGAALGVPLSSDLLGEPEALAAHLDVTIPAIRELEMVTPWGLLDLPESILKKAQEKYAPYHDWRKYPPVYHYHVCRDRGYRVLEYWFLYAYNDWATHGGTNAHEGDWEVIYIFLDDENRPHWVAYSRHFKIPLFYEPDTAQWSDERLQKVKGTMREATHPVVYVGCGSHASYLEKRIHLGGRDYAEGNYVAVGPGTDQPWGKPIRLGGKPWNMKFAGNWGSLVRSEWGVVLPGTKGPTGPAHKGYKWHHPAKWARIPPLS